MSIRDARQALAAAILAATPSALLPGRFRLNDRGAPLEKVAGADGALRLFSMRTSSPPTDSGLSASTIAQWRAGWEIWTAYPYPAAADRARIDDAIWEDLQVQANAVLPPTAWLPHLDLCAPGQPRLVEVAGAGGDTVALLGVLPLAVLYRS